jgi:hypothetical protein
MSTTDDRPDFAPVAVAELDVLLETLAPLAREVEAGAELQAADLLDRIAALLDA